MANKVFSAGSVSSSVNVVPQEVYVVTWREWESSEPVAVCASREVAEAVVARNPAEYHIEQNVFFVLNSANGPWSKSP